MPNFLPQHAEKAVLRLFEDLATPRSLAAFLLYKNNEWDQLSALAVDPRHYLDSERYWRDASASSIIRKLVELPTTVDRKAAAEATFLSCERECFRSNLRLLPYLSPGLPDTDKDVALFFRRAREICGRILGGSPSSFTGRHGPGSTFGDKGSLATIPDKMSSAPTITPDAWPFLFEWAGTLWSKATASSGRSPLFVPGNRFTTVYKDCTKDRGIAIEPSLNIFYQLSVGRKMRNRLRAWGIDLEHGQDIHRWVACEASKDGSLATVDLSNASDTICSNLVKLVLPPSWFEILDDLRSKKTLFKGRWFVLDKFSSMGNGFTFELETLIFLCLILALDPAHKAGDNVFVYGDDIIIPSGSFKAVDAMLKFLGMTPNQKKVFSDGSFRESCGGDYFDGVDVRPHFLKSSPNEPQQLIAFANGIRRQMTSDTRRRVLLRTWLTILDGIPSSIRELRGPVSLGDLLIHDDEVRWRPRWRSSIRYFQVYRPAKFRKVSWKHFRPEVILASALLGVPYGGGGVIPRDAVLGYRVGWVASS